MKTDLHFALAWREMMGLSFLLVAGCEWSGKPDPAFRPVRPDQVLAFDVLYRNHCAGCHGINGTKGPAPPLNDDRFRTIVSREDIELVLKAGRHGTPMPAFYRDEGGALTKSQIQVLAHEIKGDPYKITSRTDGNEKTFEVTSDAGGKTPQWGVPVAANETTPMYRTNRTASVADHDSQIEAGKQAFRRACAICHGNDGRGTKGKPGNLNRINSSAFLALISDQAIRRLIITGRGDLGMPGYADLRPDDTTFVPLTAEEISGLTELLSAWRATPNGTDGTLN